MGPTKGVTFSVWDLRVEMVVFQEKKIPTIKSVQFLCILWDWIVLPSLCVCVCVVLADV